MPRRKIVEPLDRLQLDGFKNYELGRKGLTPKPNPGCDAKQLVTATDLDAYADEPRGKRFSNARLRRILETAETVVVQLFTQTTRTRPRRLGAGLHEPSHYSAIDNAGHTNNTVLFVRTTSDRLAYWLAEIGRHGREDGRVLVLDGAGVATISREGANSAAV